MTPSAEPFLDWGRWLLPYAWLLGLNALVARSPRLPLVARWIAAVAAAFGPALLPAPSASNPILWGIAATVLTTLAVVSASRFADLESYLERRPRTRAEVFWWMTLPMVHERALTLSEKRQCRSSSGDWLRRGLTKELACLPILFAVHFFDATSSPWLLQSAVLILYFVLNLTAAADLCCAACTFFGFRVQSLFIAPLLSSSPRDFWSRRWNKYISRFALKHVAIPLARKLPEPLVVLAVFGTSGLFHEYFAWGVGAEGARHGLMLAFFFSQGLAIVAVGSFSPKLPPWAGPPLTFVWMALFAPLFFNAIEPALTSFGYPSHWIPRPSWLALLP